MKIEQNIHPAGVYSGISNADYHGGPGISKSGLDVIRKSPAHFKQSRDDGYKESTPSQRLGTLAHSYILEHEIFWDHHAMPFEAPEGVIDTVPQIKERLKEIGEKFASSAKKPDLLDQLRSADPEAVILDDAKAAYAEEVGDKEIITADELEKLEGMWASIQKHPKARQLLKPGTGVAELSCYWIDQETGVLCRCRPDFWSDTGWIVDLKTTRDASPDGFRKSLFGWGYFKQDPFYQDGASEALKQGAGSVDRPSPKGFAFVAIEPVAPYPVTVFIMGNVSRDIGRREYREDLATYAECLSSDHWPAYSDNIEVIELPEWRLRQEEFKNEEEI